MDVPSQTRTLDPQYVAFKLMMSLQQQSDGQEQQSADVSTASTVVL
jgi:hypothetical protein